MPSLKRTILQKAKFLNLTFSQEAVEYLITFLGEPFDEEHLDDIFNKISKKESVIEKKDLDFLTKTTINNQFEDIPQIIIHNPFENQKISSLLFGNIKDRMNFIQDRYKKIQQKLKQDEEFQKKFKISQIDTLLGSSGKKSLLGMLSKRGEDKIYLEDLSGSVRINLINTKIGSGLFSEGTIVIVQGESDINKVFQVDTMILPPIYKRLKKNSKIDDENDEKIIVLSDVHITNPNCLESIENLLSGYEESPPNMIIMIGDFIDQKFHNDHRQKYFQSFQSLGTMIKKFKSFKDTKFIFVPGPKDPGFGNVLPFPPLVESYVKGLKDKVPNSEFVTNPCRIDYKGRSIVISRFDMLHKLSRNLIIEPESNDISKHYVTTISSNQHLVPLPLHIQPVLWKCDSFLSLDPLPNIVILADQCEIFEIKEEDTLFFNPSTFSREFSFVELNPMTNETNWIQMKPK